jgi:hypothetical protein
VRSSPIGFALHHDRRPGAVAEWLANAYGKDSLEAAAGIANIATGSAGVAIEHSEAGTITNEGSS